MSLLITSPYTKEHLHLRKVKCPRHYILKPGAYPFVMERNPALKNLTEGDAKFFKVNVWRRKKDKYGRFIQNFANYDQPLVAASYAKEQIYDPWHPICIQCKQRCFMK